MTRVPKFRAWDKTDEEMVYVDEMSWTPNENGVMEFYGIGDFVTWSRLPREVEIMQSTGLKDKNGVEIFEGDIISFPDESEAPENVVKFDGLKFYIVDPFIDEVLLSEISIEMEVVGNIYENKELLE